MQQLPGPPQIDMSDYTAEIKFLQLSVYLAHLISYSYLQFFPYITYFLKKCCNCFSFDKTEAVTAGSSHGSSTEQISLRILAADH